MTLIRGLVAEFICNDLARVAIAVILLLITGALLLTDRTVPGELWALDGAATTFYFVGAATAAAIANRITSDK